MVELGLVDRIGVESERVSSALQSYNQSLRSSVTGFRQNFEHQLSEEKNNEDTERAKGLEESIAWYHKVLGFHIEGGHGN
ncbi:hypothetical protein QJS10_CPA03g00343 [Acorus calamus]|uniref:Uncharacterized protein n=1 Tax=Acorus calamus TaxID=4465 RepID=A0AAV9F856_ACOCL|nr:hypothetical protein QJS10_CPA03g00343 [Acorus calamus]